MSDIVESTKLGFAHNPQHSTKHMQSAPFSNRFILGVVTFVVSLILGLIFQGGNFASAFAIGIISLMATYVAAFVVDKRHRDYELLILDSLYRRIRELEGLKSSLFGEINQFEIHRNALHNEVNKLQLQITDRLSQRDSLNRELNGYALQRKQLETSLQQLQTELATVEKNHAELTHACSAIAAEKRRQELNLNVSRAEIIQVQTQLEELTQQKEEIESHLTLLERLKPQLEEKLHELRVNIQTLEADTASLTTEIENQKRDRQKQQTQLKNLDQQLRDKQTQLQHLVEQISLLQDERNLLQTQVWELLNQHPEQSPETENREYPPSESREDDIDVFPFSDFVDTIDSSTQPNQGITSVNLPSEWHEFLRSLPTPELQVLKAIIEQENPNPAIKKIAEANITMPSLLIDSINEHADQILGELILETTADLPVIIPEHLENARQIIHNYEEILLGRTSST